MMARQAQAPLVITERRQLHDHRCLCLPSEGSLLSAYLRDLLREPVNRQRPHVTAMAMIMLRPARRQSIWMSICPGQGLLTVSLRCDPRSSRYLEVNIGPV